MKTKITLFVIINMLLISAPTQAQQVDYKNLKIGDVLPNGDTVSSNKLINADLNLWRVTFRTLGEGKFREGITNGKFQKDFVGLAYVDASHGLISELYENGDIILYNKEYQETGRLNIHKDFNWGCEYQLYEGEAVPKLHLSSSYLIVCCGNECRLVNSVGETVILKKEIFNSVNDAASGIEMQKLSDGKFIIVLTNYERSTLYFALLDTEFKMFSNEFILDQSETNLELIEWFYSPKSKHIYLKYYWKFQVINLQGEIISTLDHKHYYPSRYNPIELDNHIYMYNSTDKEIHVINRNNGRIVEQKSMNKFLNTSIKSENSIDRIVAIESGYLILFKTDQKPGMDKTWNYTLYELDNELKIRELIDLEGISYTQMESFISNYESKQ